jgi:predicted PurR-regulated permease PerM
VGTDAALLTIFLFLAVEQVEGNVLQPLVQRYAVELPPAIFLFALLAFGVVFGIMGIVFAAPLTVVVYVLVKRLYVQEALKTPTEIPGEK